ncbi:TPR repeat protein [gamma proteobacterium HTCC5015]|nr:TPR repeat protein [gamma proteobacterium HTCC5015]
MQQTMFYRAAWCLGGWMLASSLAYAAPNNEELDRRLSTLENSSSTQVVLQLMQRLQQMEGTVAELRGQIEQQQFEMDRLKKRQRDLYLDVDRRLNELKSSGPQAGSPSGRKSAPSVDAAAVSATSMSTPATGNSTTPSDTAEKTAPSDPAAERKAYQAAFDYLREGRHQEAIKAFEGVLNEYPDGQFADNAQYWKAESHYVSKQFAEAEAGFKKVIEAYPNSNKVPDAHLKLGYTYYELKQWEQSRKILAQVVENYPTSNAANLARKRLALLSQRNS